MARQFAITSMPEQDVKQALASTHTIKDGVYIYDNSMQQYIDEHVNVPAKYYQNTMKMEEMQHRSTAIVRAAYPSVSVVNNKLLFSLAGVKSCYTDWILLYRMKAEKDMLEWDKERVLKRRHYKVRNTNLEDLMIQCANDIDIINEQSPTVVYWVTENIGKGMRRVVYIGLIPLFIDEYADKKSKYVKLDSGAVVSRGLFG